MFKSGSISPETFVTAMKISKEYGKEFKLVTKALLEFRQSVDRHESVSESAVNAALQTVKDILLRMQEEL